MNTICHCIKIIINCLIKRKYLVQFTYTLQEAILYVSLNLDIMHAFYKPGVGVKMNYNDKNQYIIAIL